MKSWLEAGALVLVVLFFWVMGLAVVAAAYHNHTGEWF